ncbi:MAG: YfhL family 4Fe-4S dicluster ferredoxin [Rhodospirillaceae bacterium]|nr:YfhL family 4Fe-4S dicluster ferredoxin [Rhodospirillales bacterium]
MSLKINDDCTSCDACVSVCPNTAISAGDVIYTIDAARCTECVGAEDSPQCQLVCPADAIVAGAVESNDQLMAKYKGLHA